MVVQKIQFNLMQNKLDDIRIVQGDTCREITFEASDIDGVLSPEDYTYMFQMVKPDHTFIIQTLTDATLKVTEQMGAITGTSYYGIRITDSNDELIYSGQGAFIVDDHVISESDIESVAEVNGYVFPDDFATTDGIAEIVEEVVPTLGYAKIADNRQNYTETWSSETIADKIASGAGDLIKDNQIAADHTWSSDKINSELLDRAIINDNAQSEQTTWSSEKIADELSQVNPEHTYSTTSQIVGKWLNGENVIEVVVDFGSAGLSIPAGQWTYTTGRVVPANAKIISCIGLQVSGTWGWTQCNLATYQASASNDNLGFYGPQPNGLWMGKAIIQYYIPQ